MKKRKKGERVKKNTFNQKKGGVVSWRKGGIPRGKGIGIRF